jgi:hypothetical protein
MNINNGNAYLTQVKGTPLRVFNFIDGTENI